MVRIAGTYGVEILAAFGVTLVCSLTAITVAMAIGLPSRWAFVRSRR